MTVLKVEQASPIALPVHSGSTRSLVSAMGAARVDANKMARAEMRELHIQQAAIWWVE
jgi:hypothetical protein